MSPFSKLVDNNTDSVRAHSVRHQSHFNVVEKVF